MQSRRLSPTTISLSALVPATAPAQAWRLSIFLPRRSAYRELDGTCRTLFDPELLLKASVEVQAPEDQ